MTKITIMIWLILWLLIGLVYSIKIEELIISKGYNPSHVRMTGTLMGVFTMIIYYLNKE